MTLKVIQHPEDKTLFPCNCFAAFGFAPTGCEYVSAVLLDNDEVEVGQTLTLAQPASADGFWSIAFTEIPRDRYPYTLLLFEARYGGRLLARVRDIVFRHVYGGSGISYPLPSSGVIPTSFTAYGTTDQSSVTAQMVLGATQTSSNAVLRGGAWFASFQNLRPDLNWAIRAFDTSNPVASGHPADSKSPINVAN